VLGATVVVVVLGATVVVVVLGATVVVVVLGATVVVVVLGATVVLLAVGGGAGGAVLGGAAVRVDLLGVTDRVAGSSTGSASQAPSITPRVSTKPKYRQSERCAVFGMWFPSLQLTGEIGFQAA
jgi:hypothetical protein